MSWSLAKASGKARRRLFPLLRRVATRQKLRKRKGSKAPAATGCFPGALPRPAPFLPAVVCISERHNTNSHVLLARYAREKGRDTVSVERKDQERTAVLPRGFLTSRGGREGAGWPTGRQGARRQGVHIHRFAQMQLP